MHFLLLLVSIKANILFFFIFLHLQLFCFLFWVNSGYISVFSSLVENSLSCVVSFSSHYFLLFISCPVLFPISLRASLVVLTFTQHLSLSWGISLPLFPLALFPSSGPMSLSFFSWSGDFRRPFHLLYFAPSSLLSLLRSTALFIILPLLTCLVLFHLFSSLLWLIFFFRSVFSISPLSSSSLSSLFKLVLASSSASSF